MLFSIAVGIFSFGKSADFHVHSLLKDEVNSAERSSHSGGITVKKHRDVLGKPVNKPNLFRTQSSSGRGNHIFNSGLVKLDDICITFYKVTVIFFCNGLFGVINPVKNFALMVNFTFRTI